VASVEGVIQFHYDLRLASAADHVPAPLLAELNAVRSVLRRLGLVGQRPGMYDGLGYGNLSLRSGRASFWISASQTSGLDDLTAEQVCHVDGWDVQRFHLSAAGASPPSSEALTHAMLYDGDSGVRCVLHAHDAAIWAAADRIGLPATSADAGYGSPAMAQGVRTLLEQHAERPLVFVTPGHRDGVFAVGPDTASTTGALVGAMVRAMVRAVTAP
jgi:ribulose-5-phosphate 4-epimerase/fuculose-1-phosphate aldolase